MASTLNPSTGKRQVSLDIAKIACIILVVIGHYDPAESPEHYKNILKVIYTFHMPVFLFISGFLYIATWKAVSFKEFITKKIKRLVIPYLTTSAIIITLKLLTQGSARVDHPVTMWSYLKMLYLPEAGYFLWFIFALFIIFMVMFFFRSKVARLVLFIVSFVISFLPSCGIDVLCIRQIQEMMVYFMTGVVIAEYAPSLFRANVLTTVALLLVFIGCETYYVYNQDSMLIYRTLAFVGIAMVMTLCYTCEHYFPVLSRSCVVLAPSVYIIYLFHTTILGLAKSAFAKTPFISGGSDATFYLQATCAVACGVIVPILLHHLIIKRSKILKVLFGV